MSKLVKNSHKGIEKVYHNSKKNQNTNLGTFCPTKAENP